MFYPAIWPTTGNLMVVDTTRCTGCRACQVACQQWNQLKAEDTTFSGTYQNPPDLSGTNLNIVRFVERDDVTVKNYGTGIESSAFMWLMCSHRCRHCEDPKCKTVCPRSAPIHATLTAIVKRPDGTVDITADCDPTACGLECQNACIYSVPKWTYVANSVTKYAKIGGNYIMKKCNMCYDRLTNATLGSGLYNGAFGDSQKPACVLACPTGGLQYGSLATMKTKAKNRKWWLKNVWGYPKANIYTGKPSSNGTHVVWILYDDPSMVGF